MTKYQVMPDLTPVEYEALKADIAQNGVLVPVEVDEDGNTLDGHHRIRAWQELRDEGRQLPDYPFILRPGLSEQQKRNHARRLNVQRRHLTPDQKAKIAEELVRDRDAEVSARQAISEAAELTGLSTRRVEQVTSDIRQEEKEQRNRRIQELADLGWSQRDIADEVGVDVATVNRSVAKSKDFDFATPLPGIIGTGESGMRKAAKLAEYANGSGIMTVDYAEDVKIEEDRTARRQDRTSRIQEIAKSNKPLNVGIDQQYPIIYLDPPWQYEHSKTDNRVIENHYPTMTLDELKALPVPEIAAPDCVMFMWVTSPKLAEAVDLLNAWGFTYRTNIVWDKERIGMGYYARQQHELLFVAARGSLPVPLPENRIASVVRLRRENQHSSKPVEFYEIIENMYPEYAKIELFARVRRDGWQAWGNQA